MKHKWVNYMESHPLVKYSEPKHIYNFKLLFSIHDQTHIFITQPSFTTKYTQITTSMKTKVYARNLWVWNTLLVQVNLHKSIANKQQTHLYPEAMDNFIIESLTKFEGTQIVSLWNLKEIEYEWNAHKKRFQVSTIDL
jgi:hypothetical protein